MLAISPSVAAQNEADSIPRTGGERILHNTDSLRALQFEAGPMKFTPFLAPSYTPEMQALLTAGGLITFTFDRGDKELLRSNIPASIGYSSNGSLQISIKTNLYLRGDRMRISGEIWRKDMPDNYYGVGFARAREIPKGDSTSAYHRNWRRMYAKAVHQFKPNYFIGGIFDATNTKATDLNPVMTADRNVLENGANTRNRGLGLVMEYDSRDMPVNAYTGMFLDLSVVNYGKHFGGQSNFWTVDLDYRQYKPLAHRRTLAWQLRSRTSYGEVPWTEMAQIGTPWDLRGYTWGQYRDKLMAYGMTEYRHMFNRKRPNKRGSMESRWGAVACVGVGTVAPDYSSIPAALPNGGVGIRFETEKRANVRIDYGRGAYGSSAFYVTFYEAF
ncbi:MAG: BamA/TamA family outer membrane protein [Flavobacteriales bacterium]